MLTYEWFVDDASVSRGESDDYKYKPAKTGVHVIKVEISDGNETVVQIWEITVLNREQGSPFGILGNPIILATILIVIFGALAGIVSVMRARKKVKTQIVQPLLQPPPTPPPTT